jgi:hypothetical protein
MRWLPLSGVAAGVIALNLLGGSAMAATPAKAPKPRDVAAARALIRTVAGFDEAALRHEGAMTAAAKALVAQVQAGCPQAIPSSALNGTKQQQNVTFDLSLEGAFDLSLDVLHPLHDAAQALSNGLGRVHFSKRAFTRAIHATGHGQSAIEAVKPSDLCANVKTAAAGAFAADPPATTAFLKVLHDAAHSTALAIPDMLKKVGPYLATARDRAALNRVKTVDTRYENFAAKLGIKWVTKLLSALVSPPPSGGGTGGFPTNPPPPSTTRTAVTAAFAVL